LSDKNYSQSEAEVTLGLLRAVHEDASLTQRSAAQELGVALGLVNTYLKRCATKGFVKVRQIPSRRYAYYLTPKGFAEKSRLTAEFLGQSLSLFRQAQHDYREILDYCVQRNWQSIILFGVSDLAEIISLYAREYPIEIKGIVDARATENEYANLPIFAERSLIGEVDAYIITDLREPHSIYEKLVAEIPAEHVMAPKLLEISKSVKMPPARGNK
jgi:DNA-binding MarR family transcriptional regulator